MQEAKESLSVLLSRSFPQGKADLLTDRGSPDTSASGVEFRYFNVTFFWKQSKVPG